MLFAREKERRFFCLGKLIIFPFCLKSTKSLKPLDVNTLPLKFELFSFKFNVKVHPFFNCQINLLKED